MGKKYQRTTTPLMSTGLPNFSVDEWSWHDDAACASEDPDLFFYADWETGDEKKYRIKAAKNVCATCPVSTACLEWAIRVNETDGIWGGLTPEERGVGRRKRPTQTTALAS